jgi:peptidoglycan/xylan/chitin deacetylase (PgdA/CDA1 family)
MIVPARIPSLIQRLFNKRIWRIETDRRELFLTFDDGPHPRITSAVLDILKKHDAKATFFCIGDRVKRFPHIYKRILDEGHAVGNHTMHHLNGWKSGIDEYCSDVEEAAKYIHSNLFRPPYGRINSKQFKYISAKEMKTIMWTVLSGDYDSRLSPREINKRIMRGLQKGNIYLFHDSEKAEVNMMFVLEQFIEYAKNHNYSFSSIKC